MPVIVEIPEVGEIEFPDSMSEDQINEAAGRLHREAAAKAAPATPSAETPSGLGVWERFKAAVRPGLQAMGTALAEDPAANEAAGQAIRDAVTGVALAAQSGLDTISQGLRRVPGPLPGTSGPDPARAVAHPLTPMAQLPRVAENPDRGTAAQVAAGVANVGAGIAEGLLTPLGVATLGAGALPNAAQRLLAGAFAVDMARHLPEMAAQAADALEGGPVQRRVETIGNLVATSGLAGIAGKHAITPKRVTAARGLAKELDRAELKPADAADAAPIVEPLSRPFPSPAQEAANLRPQPPRPPEAPNARPPTTAGPERPATESPGLRVPPDPESAAGIAPDASPMKEPDASGQSGLPSVGMEQHGVLFGRNQADRPKPNPNEAGRILKAWEAGAREGVKWGHKLRQFIAAAGYGEADLPPFYDNPADPLAMAWEAGFTGHPTPRFVRALRIGKIPESGRSFNHREQQFEPGVSVLQIEGENRSHDGTFEMFNDGAKTIVEGWEHYLKGTDGEPLLVGARIVAAAKPERPATESPPLRVPPDPEAAAGVAPDASPMPGFDGNVVESLAKRHGFQVAAEHGSNFGSQYVEVIDPATGGRLKLRFADHERQLSSVLNHQAPDFEQVGAFNAERLERWFARKRAEIENPPRKSLDQRAREEVEQNLLRLQAELQRTQDALKRRRKQAALGSDVAAKVANLEIAETKLLDLIEHWQKESRGITAAAGTQDRVSDTLPAPGRSGVSDLRTEVGNAERAEASPLQPASQAEGLPTGTTPISGTRMPVAVDRVVPGQQDIPGIFGQLERVMEVAGSPTPIRTGRMGGMKRWASGFFKPREETIRLQSSFNLPTAAHEVAHSVSASLWRRPAGGTPPSRMWKKMAPPAVHSELHALGTKLYGTRKPAAGYAEEGFAEFMRHWLTTDEASAVAPATAKWFKKTVVDGMPQLGAELGKARKMIDVWRGQGDRGRALAMQKPYPGRARKWYEQLRQTWSVQGQVEQLTPLERVGRHWQARKGTPMPAGQDPFLVATRLRGLGPSVMDRFVHRGTVTIDGNPTGNRGLADILAPVLSDLPGWQRGLHAIHPKLAGAVHERIQDFGLYLWARRTLERASHGQETGLSVDDATTLIARLDSPRFQAAADQYRQWWDDVLDYYGSAGPANAELVKAVKAGSHDYVPLPRVLDTPEARTSEGGRQGGGLTRMRGSGRPIYDVMESTVRVAERLIEKAHRDLVANTVIDVSGYPGFGFLVEEVPLDRVRQAVPVETVRRQLEDLGVNTAGVAPDALLEWYTEARDPKGVDPVYARRDGQGKMHWYVLAPDVFEVIGGVDSPRVAAGMLAGLAAWGTRTFKMGTTGLRPAFNLVTNPLRDAQNFGFQVQGTANPARMLGAYMASVADMLKASLGMGRVKPSEWWEALHDLGVPMANSLAHDIVQTRSALRGAWHGKFLQTVTSPVNSFRELIGGFETVPREAQLRILASEMGWKPGMPLTRDQAVALTVAAKRVTTDFTAGGSHARNWNLYIPFYNAAIQGTRATARTLRTAADRDYAERIGSSQKQALGRIALGGAFLTTLGLGNWLRNRDKEWYRALPWRERFLFTNIEMDDGTVARVPRPIDWGNLFMVLPEALADSWYQKDPETAAAAVEHIVMNMNPVGLPAPANAILEQFANRDFFWDRPIVPRGEVDLLPGDQRNEYSSWLATALGDAFPNHVSPRRVDAGIRQVGGGAAADLVEVLGLGGQVREREKEPADLPVIGTLFRRGGTYTAANRYLVDFQNLYAYFRARSRSKERPLNAQELAFWQRLQTDKEFLDERRDKAIAEPDLGQRQTLYRAAGEKARRVMEDAKKLKMAP